MSKHIGLGASLLATLFLSPLIAASLNAFVGIWIWNPTSTMTIERVGTNEYEFTYAVGVSERLVADGAFHSSKLEDGREVSFQKIGEDEWTFKDKDKDKSHSESTMKVSRDGKTMTESSANVSPKGEASKVTSLFSKTKAGTGIEGEWTQTKYEGPKTILTVKSDGGNGMMVSNSRSHSVQHLRTLDDKPYKEVGPTTPYRDASSAKLLDEHTLQMTDYHDGKVVLRGKWSVSADEKTLTMLLTQPDGKSPYSVSYQKQ